jgi:nitroimidazol reductase NimA-like FMN-containing flavoprotein (pyridoxamine 5'-phosphate oxidase superfamily)
MTLDELDEYGMARLDEREMRGVLASQKIGVLGLPTEGAPYLLPLSFGFDGESTLYFLYVLGGESRKADLTDATDVASFLVYSAETTFNWRSVLLEGTISEVPDDERERILETTQLSWRPDLFETASQREATRLYQFVIREWSGIKHTGLPPGFESA